MKNVKLTILGTVALLLAVGLNVRHALNDYGIRDNKLHVEVLAQTNGSGGGGSTGGLSWICRTYTSETYDQTGYSYECGKDYVVSTWDTRECNNGVFSFCYPDYIVTYYNCDGSINRVNDQTNMYSCF